MINDRYQILTEVGRGSFCTVFEGKDTVRNRNVAIKIESPGIHPSKLNLDCQAMEEISSPGIPRVY